VTYLFVREDAELLRRGEAWMAAQNRLFVSELVERWVKANGNEASARHLAAQLLAGVGSSAQALVYEPTNELALLRVATSAEKGGLLIEATQSLQTLLKAHPESAHGRLRLGVVLRKQGQEAEAAKLLGEVMADAAAPRWVTGLACQQLAEMAYAKGQRDRGDALLREGTETIGLQSLFVELAFRLDERQRPDEAVAVLNGMPVTTGPRESSGRHMYNAAPEVELALARRQVEERVAGEWPQLRAALRIAAVPQQGSR
jgi:tetratricopeptide (TPR) repeat protein